MLPQDWYNENELQEIHAREWLENSVDALRKMGMASTPDFFPGNIGMNAMMSGGVADGASDGAELGIIFPQNTGGAKAGAIMMDENSVITLSANKQGIAGNRINWSVLARDGMFECIEFFDGQIISTQMCEGLHEFQNGAMTTVSYELPDGYDPHAAGAEMIPLPLGQIALSGGSSGTNHTYSERQSAFQLAAAAYEHWDVIAFSIDPEDANYVTAINSHKAWLDQLNNDPPQRSRKSFIFVPSGASSDNSSVYNVNDRYRFDGEILTPAQVVLHMAGLSAGAAGNKDLTASFLRRVTDLQPLPGQTARRTARQRETAINTGFMILNQSDDGGVYIVREINSFVRTRRNKTIQWTDGKTGRIRDLWMQAVNHAFLRYFQGQVDDTEEERENFQIALYNLAAVFESQQMLRDNDISRIRVESAGFKAWKSSYIPFDIPMTIDTLDMITRINF
jgi:hypothetical protein